MFYKRTCSPFLPLLFLKKRKHKAMNDFAGLKYVYLPMKDKPKNT
uniref:Uncharacterized protein n=1 Tax=uncultured Vibrionales bacterium HF0010_22E23 TaxID=710999 RepID=E0XRJ1_9GAMM|nr:hypothetical protein [uncultured Vibrionales bacterium HF0010_22E23]